MEKIPLLPLIGSTEYIDLGEEYLRVPAKIDTGADSSSVWASNIEIVESGALRFTLFAPESPHYTGDVIETTEYKVSVIRSSNGEEQIRYRTHFTVRINDKKVRASLTLADRSKNHFPVLIGRKTISGKFYVDVSKTEIERPKPNKRNKPLLKELKENPYKFHQKYGKKGK